MSSQHMAVAGQIHVLLNAAGGPKSGFGVQECHRLKQALNNTDRCHASNVSAKNNFKDCSVVSVPNLRTQECTRTYNLTLWRVGVTPSAVETQLVFVISSLRRVLYVVCFLLGNSPASGVYMPAFRNTVCSIFIGRQMQILLTSTCL